MDLGIKGRRAIVTGGSSGIGFETARQLLEEGVRVLICGGCGDTQPSFFNSFTTICCSSSLNGSSVAAVISAATSMAASVAERPRSVSATARRRRSFGSLTAVTKPRAPRRSTTPLMVAASR